MQPIIQTRIDVKKQELDNKNTELHEMHEPKANVRQRLYTRLTGKTNNADKALIGYNDNKTSLENATKILTGEIDKLTWINTKIRELMPIYSTHGGKYKSRRNIQRNKSTRRKGHKKSNRRTLSIR
jgi:hypothetical protein